MRWTAVVVLGLGCSEYDLKSKGEVPNPGEDSSEPDTDPEDSGGLPVETGEIEVDECAEQEIPGYSAAINKECENEVETGTFTPVIEWKKSSWSTSASSNQVMSQPIVVQLTDDDGDGDIDTDDTPDIVVMCYSNSGDYTTGGVLRAVSGADGAEIFNLEGHSLQGTGGIAAADIDGDGLVEIVAPTPSAVVVFENDGTKKWVSGSISGSIYGVSDNPAISDMDGDGNPEIIIGSAVIDNAGNVIGTGQYGRGGVSSNVGTTSFAVDVDGDGIQEVVTGNALYTANGTTIWYNGQNDGYPAVGNFDSDAKAEIVVSGNAQIRLQDDDGTVLWTETIPGAGSSYYGGPPTVADFDGDGEPEIGVAAGSRYTVFEGDGTILWQATTDDSSSGNTGSAVFDFEGDGAAEVVYADQTTLWVFSGVDGTVKLESSDHSNGTWLEYPTIADVDGDGQAEIVVAHTAQYGSFEGITVFGDADDSWRPGRKIWNQHAYHITNVDEDGTVPAPADQNWLTYNNFRSGDMSAGDGVSAPDLTLAEGDICEADCDVGVLRIWVHPGNEGKADLDVEATVRILADYGTHEEEIESTLVPPTMIVGEYMDALEFEVDASLVDGADQLHVEISSDELDCDEDNNRITLSGPFCVE